MVSFAPEGCPRARKLISGSRAPLLGAGTTPQMGPGFRSLGGLPPLCGPPAAAEMSRVLSSGHPSKCHQNTCLCLVARLWQRLPLVTRLSPTASGFAGLGCTASPPAVPIPPPRGEGRSPSSPRRPIPARGLPARLPRSWLTCTWAYGFLYSLGPLLQTGSFSGALVGSVLFTFSFPAAPTWQVLSK